MEAAKMLLNKYKAANPVGSAPIYRRGDADEIVKAEYQAKQEIKKREEAIKLGKRLQELDEYMDKSAQMVNSGQQPAATFEPMLNVITAKKKNRKLEQEEQEEAKVLKVDANKRDSQELDRDPTQEELDQFIQRNKVFTEKFQVSHDSEFKKDDLSEGISIEEMSQDVYIWILKMMQEWKYDLGSKPVGWDRTLEGKSQTQVYTECKRVFWNLYDLLAKHTCNETILRKIYHLAHYCWIKEYKLALDNYMDLSIGNAPWPIGVTMVGIHERSGRAKIFSSQIAHIMNDEAQKQIILNMKRLLTFCQKRFPTTPSKMVIF